MKDGILLNFLSRVRPEILIILAVSLAGQFAGATVITGNIVNQSNYVTFTITDGAHSADFLWSEAAPGASGYVYGTGNTSVAVATGVTNVTQISDASSYSFTSSYVGPVLDAAHNAGIGQFVVLQTVEGYYAAVRIDDFQNDEAVSATWYLQTDGTADFSGFVPPAPTLAQALDATNLTWSTNGNTGWFAETNVTEDGVSAAQSGHITDGQVSDLSTTVPANGQISFFWKVSSEEGADFLTFYINGVQQNAISGEVDWNQRTYAVSAGDVLTWEYKKDVSVSQGQDAGWVDQVQLVPSAVTLSIGGGDGGNFQLSFQTLAGRPQTIQMRTNLTSGAWEDLTNFIGDGSPLQFNYAQSNSPAAFFRVVSQ